MLIKVLYRGSSYKTIDPGYNIRSAPANTIDNLFCSLRAQNAVYAAMSGKTEFLRAYANFDVSKGKFTIFAEFAIVITNQKKDQLVTKLDSEGDFKNTK